MGVVHDLVVCATMSGIDYGGLVLESGPAAVGTESGSRSNGVGVSWWLLLPLLCGVPGRARPGRAGHYYTIEQRHQFGQPPSVKETNHQDTPT